MKNNSGSGLWNSSFGEIGATLKTLEDLGVTNEHLTQIRSDPGFAKIVADVFLRGIEKPVVRLYADERVQSNRAYPSEYNGPKPIEVQIKKLAKIFNLNSKFALQYAKTLSKSPKGEGYFAIVRPGALSSVYSQAVQVALDELKKARPNFCNYREGQIDEQHVRLSEATGKNYEKFSQEQKGDIWIISAQLGSAYKGQSSRCVIEEFISDEFSLDAIAGISIVLVHSERLTRYDELDMWLPGTQFSYGADGVFSRVAVLCFDDDEVRFGAIGADCPDDSFGVASGFPSS